jgi:hypothetical protein
MKMLLARFVRSVSDTLQSVLSLCPRASAVHLNTNFGAVDRGTGEQWGYLDATIL